MSSLAGKAARFVAGESYPDMSTIAEEATLDGATYSEVSMSQAAARRAWARSFITVQGLRSWAGDVLHAAADYIKQLDDQATGLKEEHNYRGDT